MPRRGRSTTIGKFAKFHQDRRVSEIRLLGEALRREGHTAPDAAAQPPPGAREVSAAR
ncbi:MULTISPECIES: hypothetical protein [Micromonospora]|jgi:hypothetical protein|uniref:hypothetical protein n=1 Tax=Micromonospora TaxID=1873 RepID=UPI0024173115|nr:hypothetical protein [Micromonospora sp. WMMD956]MDG4816792.1 hypothetical protein [Micromonospora sp. WMMD956]